MALRELRRAVDGGVLFVAMKEGEGQRWVRMHQGASRFFAFYRLPELRLLLQEAGWAVAQAWCEPPPSPGHAPWLNLIARAQ